MTSNDATGDALQKRDTFDKSLYRLSMPFGVRLSLALTMSSVGGFMLGAAHGGTMGGLRFRAEHAHKMPVTHTGWYLYHKSKNYHAMWGGLKEGFKLAGKLSIWVAFLISAEEAVDCSRGGSKDFMSSVVAGLSCAGAFSVWSECFPCCCGLLYQSNGCAKDRFPMHTAARTVKLGLKSGLAYGLLQDLVGMARGRRPGYVKFLTALPEKWQKAGHNS